MSVRRIRVTLDQKTLNGLDRLVRERRYSSRSVAIRQAIIEKFARLNRRRLTRECAKLDPAEERQMAEFGFARDIAAWPPY